MSLNNIAYLKVNAKIWKVSLNLIWWAYSLHNNLPCTYFKHSALKCVSTAVQGADPGTIRDVGAVRGAHGCSHWWAGSPLVQPDGQHLTPLNSPVIVTICLDITLLINTTSVKSVSRHLRERLLFHCQSLRLYSLESGQSFILQYFAIFFKHIYSRERNLSFLVGSPAS